MRKFIGLILILLLMGCASGGGDGGSKCKNNSIHSHMIYLNAPPWTELDKVPPETEFAIRLDFIKCDADTYGLWFQATSAEGTYDEEDQPAEFYELSPASVGITLYWFLCGVNPCEDTWVDVWLEMEDGSTSAMYSFLIEVE